jgi:hypothetical protein
MALGKNQLLIQAQQHQLGAVRAQFDAIAQKLTYADVADVVRLEDQLNQLNQQMLNIQAQIHKLEQDQEDSALKELVSLLTPEFTSLAPKVRLAFQKALNQRTIAPLNQGLESLVQILVSRVIGEQPYPWLHRFVEYLLWPEPDLVLGATVSSALAQWANAHIHDRAGLQQLIQQEQTERHKQQPCLLIRIRRSNQASTNSKDDHYYASAWYIEDIHAYRAKQPTQIKPVYPGAISDPENQTDAMAAALTSPEQIYTVNEIEVVVQQLRQACMQQYGGRRPMVQIFLPLKLMDADIDVWPIQPGKSRKRFGTEHEVILRAGDRLNPSEYELGHDWQAKWRDLETQFAEFAHGVFKSAQDADSVYGIGRLPGVLGISLAKAISTLSEQERIDLFEALILDSDIPLALWVRQSCGGIDCLKELETVLKNCCIGKLSTSILNKRLEPLTVSPELRPIHIGNHLSLLWDDPNLLPPDLPRAV